MIRLRRSAPLVLFSVFLMAITVLCSTRRVTGESGNLQPIGIALSIADLLSSTAIRLSSGGTVRLGVEAVVVSRTRTALVYALTDDAPARSSSLPTCQLGPVAVTVRRHGSALVGPRSDGEFSRGKAPVGVRPYLYAKEVAFAAEGRFDVTAWDGAVAVAQATITFAGMQGMPDWCPLEVRSLRSFRALDDYTVRSCVAVPVRDGMVPRPVTGASMPLPTACGTATPEIALLVSAGAVTLTDTLLRPMISECLESRLLVRSWRDGVPVFPPGEKRAISYAQFPALDLDGDRVSSLSFTLRLPEWLSLRREDRLDVQFQYCPAGWTNVLGHSIGYSESGDDQPRMSSRLTFVGK